MAEQWASRLYNSQAWKDLRRAVIAARGSRCQLCGRLVTDDSQLVVHHVKELTPENIGDPNVAMNPDNLQVICRNCHDIIHRRYKAEGIADRQVYIVYGAPCSGKTTYVKRMATRGDLIVDVDMLFFAVSGLKMYDKPRTLNQNVFAIRDMLIDNIRTRYGKWKNAYIVGGYPHKVDREELKRKLNAIDIYIEADKDECLARARAERGVFGEEWAGYVERWFDEFEPDPSPPT